MYCLTTTTWNWTLIEASQFLQALTMASTKTVLRLASKRPLATASPSVVYAQHASFSLSARRCEKTKAEKLRDAPPDLLSELRKAPRLRESRYVTLLLASN